VDESLQINEFSITDAYFIRAYFLDSVNCPVQKSYTCVCRTYCFWEVTQCTLVDIWLAFKGIFSFNFTVDVKVSNFYQTKRRYALRNLILHHCLKFKWCDTFSPPAKRHNSSHINVSFAIPLPQECQDSKMAFIPCTAYFNVEFLPRTSLITEINSKRVKFVSITQLPTMWRDTSGSFPHGKMDTISKIFVLRLLRMADCEIISAGYVYNLTLASRTR
jgi:hypothetical protein